MGFRVAVAGASGYAGGELLRLIAGHPHLELGAATAHSQAGAPLAAVHPHLARPGDLTLAATDPAALADADLVFLALPHGESAALAAAAAAGGQGRRPRRRPPARPTRPPGTRYYGGPHAGAWTYGLPELPGQREPRSRRADRVAATGCYAAAITLALAPLIAAGVAEPDDVVVVAASGTSGAGRAAKPHLLASEVMGDLSPYKVGAHQHMPEIKQATGARGRCRSRRCWRRCRAASWPRSPRPADRGTGDAAAEVLRGGVRRRAVRARAARRARGRTPRRPLGSNTVPPAGHRRRATRAGSIVVSALDNLGKGAAGQAVQCANLMLGLPETAGLSALRSARHDASPPRKGFRAAGVAAGLKAGGAPTSRWSSTTGPTPTAAGVFTANRVKAAPVLWSQQVLRAGLVRAVVLNSGGANACTGPAASRTPTPRPSTRPRCAAAGDRRRRRRGLLHRADRRAAADGQLLRRRHARRSRRWPRDGGAAAAEAIMTTDTRPKTTVVDAATGWTRRRHGQGRRHARPGLATMLVRAHHRRGRRRRDARRGAARGVAG